ncbi:uncharacterized protein PG986_004163 [Apiospora aurea]|uniref:Uncharacterized protein n=1 Tax=Apiospora aurea TaxID=335848 RepID=A0ABR1QLT4_9PEZI
MNKFLTPLLVAIVTMTMGERAPQVPRETGLVPPAAAAPVSASVPAPAPAPETAFAVAFFASAAPAITTTSNTWVNSQTCGWVANVSSYPWTCDPDYSCTTNKAHVIGCASGTYSPLFSVCVDYSAVVAGSCDVANTNSGCCSVVTMLDEPQFVLDSRTSTSTGTGSITSTTSDSGGVAASPTATPSSSSSSTTDAAGSGGDDKETINVVAITIGTILGFFLVLGLVRFAASFRFRYDARRRQQQGGGNGNGNGGGGGGSGGNESHIELVVLPQQPQRQQQQQEQERQI